MDSNQKFVGWTELKGQGTGQIQVPENETFEFKRFKQLMHERESLKSDTPIKTRAERQLSEVQDLLQLMENLQSTKVHSNEKV